jgi:hypothetical protein
MPEYWWVILIAFLALPLMYLWRTFSRKWRRTKTGLLVFFLLFIGLVVTFTIQLVNHFGYVRLFILLFFFIAGMIEYYRRYKAINN